MKKLILILILIVSCFHACNKDQESSKLKDYLKTYNLNINDYKVICFVPVDGCGPCINPSLNYARNARQDYLLVMSSMFRKSIDNTIERVQISNKNYVSDYNNLAQETGMVTPFAPCYYFLRYGEIIRKYDLTQTNDKTGILSELEQFFFAEDSNLNEMEKLRKLQINKTLK